MPTNPGERYPQPTVAQQATRGTIHFFHPILDAAVLFLAIILYLQGFGLAALGVAFLAGRLGAR